MGAQPLRFTLTDTALHKRQPLTPERHEVIRDRLERGFYRQPEVLMQTAERLFADLMSDDPFGDSPEPDHLSHPKR